MREVKRGERSSKRCGEDDDDEFDLVKDAYCIT